MKWPSLDESVSLCICLLNVACNREMQKKKKFLIGYLLWGGGKYFGLGATFNCGPDDLGYGPGSGFNFEPVQTSTSGSLEN